MEALAAAPRVRLRPLLPPERPQLAAWCPGYNRAAAQELVAVLLTNDQMVGVLGYGLNDPGEGCCTFHLAVIAPDRRGFGLGSEAVRALEGHLAATMGVRCFRALVPETMGLAFYFWLRLGYAPDACRQGQMSMVRCQGGG
ncbi:MAG: GNAT family N-acetyltransferase [Dehalococcoidia bacterium]|jgi:RimJ/RimL family protein N-acetyltransferase|nr:GNAT family N-acetyltransferase [Dehalococcoidia bacterium]MDW8008798.1 GNAT family N-acetyltransferase [Chloroflexota bacterium]